MARAGVLFLLVTGVAGMAAAQSAPGQASPAFPLPLESYGDSRMTGVWEVLSHRVQEQPLNLWVTLVFVGALVHAIFANKFLHWSHAVAERQKAQNTRTGRERVSIAANVLHLLAEVEAVFGIWCVPLFLLLAIKAGWKTPVNYFGHDVSYVEPVFVVVIMAMASTRPILRAAEGGLRAVAGLGGGGPVAWWLTILTLGPVLGSFITEPAAMTISALLLAKQFYAHRPSPRFAYATLGLLFVNISVGGVLTHFAAPPVLMVARPWGWDTPFMLGRFGWVALVGIALANTLYCLAMRKQFSKLSRPPAEAAREVSDRAGDPIPAWVTLVHVAFMACAIVMAHYPALLIGGFLFFVAFCEVTENYQGELQLRAPVLVGFFLAGLVIHGGLQQWWIQPLLSRLSEVRLILSATALTAFIDNAAITDLATLAPNLSDAMKYAVVAGAIAGGGLTVIANAPNPAGQAILGRFFPSGISPMGLLLGALPATAIMTACFLLAR